MTRAAVYLRVMNIKVRIQTMFVIQWKQFSSIEFDEGGFKYLTLRDSTDEQSRGR